MTLPEPMTPADCDLRGLEYMPLLGQRLFGSDFNGMANDSEWRAGLTLWWAAWTQCPAGSLPDDDAALCRLADLGRDTKTWKKLRERALHGFVKCSDGRLYHPTLAEQALVAWDKRQQDREARSGNAERKAKERAERTAMFEHLKAVGVTPAWNIKTADLRDLVTEHCHDPTRTNHDDVTRPVTVTVTAKTGRDVSSVPNGTGSELPKTDPAKVLFDAGVALLTETGLTDRKARNLVAKWRKENGDGWTREAIASAAGKTDPVAWIEGRRRAREADEDEARAASSATAERYRRMAIPGPPALGAEGAA